MQSGAIQPAIVDLGRMIAAQPRTPGAYLFLGTACLGKREPAKAAEAYRRIVTLAPKDPRGPYLVGLGLLAQDRGAETSEDLEAALALAVSTRASRPPRTTWPGRTERPCCGCEP